jgi:hypothetical protein
MLFAGLAALEDQSSTTEEPDPPQYEETPLLVEPALSSEGHVPPEEYPGQLRGTFP